MISSKEAATRIQVGYVLLFNHLALNAAPFCGIRIEQTLQSAFGCVLGAAGVMLYQMGRDSQ